MKTIIKKMPEIMDQAGLSDCALVTKYSKPGLEANDERVIVHEGVVMDRLEVPNWTAREGFLDKAFRLKGLSPKNGNGDDRDQGPQLLSIWGSLTPPERASFLEMNPEAAPLVHSLSWMFNWTATEDPQDPANPCKPFPRRPYFSILHELYELEPILFIEKSRTMMCSWWAAAESLHATWIRQPSRTVLWAQDEDRAVILIDMCWTLTEQDKILRRYYPLDRPRDRQAYNRIEFKGGSAIFGLPGKDSDKIQGEHPSRLVIDEAAFIPNGGEAFDIALATKVTKILAISSAAPGWFRNVTRDPVPVPLDA